jgi:hypothetical protein
MRLGDLFSEGDRRDYVRRNFRVGIIFYLYCDFIRDPKDKYILLLDPSDPPLCLIISTRIPAIYEKRAHLRTCQVRLREEENRGIIEHDCHIDCTIAYNNLSYADIEEQVIKDPGRIKGLLSLDRLTEVRDALDRDVRMPTEDKARILMRLDAILP